MRSSDAWIRPAARPSARASPRAARAGLIDLARGARARSGDRPRHSHEPGVGARASGALRAIVSRRLRTSCRWRRSGSLASSSSQTGGRIRSRGWSTRPRLVLAPIAPKAEFGVAAQLAIAGGGIPVRSIASLPLRGWRAALERERAADRSGDRGRPTVRREPGRHVCARASRAESRRRRVRGLVSRDARAGGSEFGELRRTNRLGSDPASEGRARRRHSCVPRVGGRRRLPVRTGRRGSTVRTTKRWQWRVSTRWTVSAFSSPM